MTSATSGTGTAYPPEEAEFTVFKEVVTQSFVFCRPLFVFLSFLFPPMSFYNS